jgi:hypothetical protein
MKTLKYEEVYRQEYRDLPDALCSLRRFIEKVYNEKRLHSALGAVRRQLLFPVNDNYFSRSTTTTSFSIANFSSILVLAGAEGKALQGCTLSADSGARPDRGGYCSAPPVTRQQPGMAGKR